MKKTSISTDDTYEAAYYLLKGADIEDIEFSHIKVRKYSGQRKVVRDKWRFKLVNVPVKAVDAWWSGKVRVNARDYADSRVKLKKIIYEKKTGNKVSFWFGQ